MNFKVVEKFVSVNGEGRLSGQLAIFIRFAGCNLDCSYCDTKWANEKSVEYTLMNEDEIYEYIKSTGVKNITLTGGEPLLQNGLIELLLILSKDEDLLVEIETNGSISLKEFLEIQNPPRFVMDYKLPTSNMEQKMLVDNFIYLTKKDTVKFVAGSIEDLERAKYLINHNNLINKTNVYISPVFGNIQIAKIVEFMQQFNMNGVTLQVQLHKIIWDPEERGV